MNYSVRLDGKVAIVTGGSRGLGAAMSRGLARSGAQVVVARRDLARCEALAAEIRGARGEARALRADAADTGSLDALLDATYQAYGRLDILVNNAGINVGFRPLSELTTDDFDRMYAVNLRGPWRSWARSSTS